MIPRAVFFDLDDTLISFDNASEPAWRKVCYDYSFKTGLFRSEDIYNMINKIAGWYWSDPERHRQGRLDLDNTRRMIVSMALKELKCPDLSLTDQITADYTWLREELIELFPQTIRTLEFLKTREIPIGLITNGNSLKQRAKIERFNLYPFFNSIIIEEEAGFGKPDRRVYEMALQSLNIKPEETWMIGDNLTWDIQGAQAVGIYAIWHDYRKKGLPDHTCIIPDRIIHQIGELINFFI